MEVCSFSPGESLRYPLHRRLGGPQIRSGRFGQYKTPCPGCHSNHDSSTFHPVAYFRGAQIPGAMSMERLNFVRWHLIFLGPQYGTSMMSPFWRLEFCGVPRFLENLCTLAIKEKGGRLGAVTD